MKRFTEITKYIFVINAFIFLYACSSIDIEPLPDIEISHNFISINFDENQTKFSFTNTGNVPLNWKVTASEDYILINPFSGRILPGETVNPEVRVLKNELKEGRYNPIIAITTDHEIGRYIKLNIISYKEQKWLIDVGIVDAEYDKVNDRIIAISDQNSLLIIDPREKSIISIPIEIPGLKVSLHPDGNTAVVGHIAALSQIDINRRQVIKQIGLPFEIYDIVMGPKNWVYISPLSNSYRSLYNINLETEEQGWFNSSNSIYQSRLKLHPSGKFIFAANTTVSPSNVHKVNISQGKASSHYSTPYHGNFPFDGDIWIADDGLQFFAKSGYIFKITDDRAFDMTNIGKLASDHQFTSIDHSSKNGKIYGLYKANILAKYDFSYQLLEKVTLPPFMIKDSFGNYHLPNSHAQFGFFNREGDMYYTISKSLGRNYIPGMLTDHWAIISVPVF